MEQSKRIFGLDLLRFIAICSVLYCHFAVVLYPFVSGKGEVFFNLSIWLTSYYGVELFFVLSGFLIGSIFIKAIVNTMPNSKNLLYQVKDFWLRRWIRTLPNYFLFVVLNVLMLPITQSEFDFQILFNYIFFLQGTGLRNTSFFGVSWSLAVEEWFYLLMPLFFIVASFFTKNKERCFLVAVSCLFIIPMFSKMIYAFQHSSSAISHNEVFRYATFYKIDAIGFGVLFSWIWMKENIKVFLTNQKKKLLIVGLFLLLCSFAYIYIFLAKTQQNPFLFAALSFLCCIAVLFCFPAIIHLKVKSNTIFYRTVILISLSSYSLYLCHSIVMQLSDYFFKNLLKMDNIFIAILYIVFLLTTSIAIAHFIYRYFEQPILNKREAIILKFKNTL